MNIKKLKDALSISFQIQLLIERITLLPLNYTRYNAIIVFIVYLLYINIKGPFVKQGNWA